MIARWDAAETYPDAKSTSLDQWAWEFVRRNPEYKADWQRYQRCCTTLRDKHPSIDREDREPTEFAFLHDDPVGVVYDPPRHDDESEDRWIERVGKGKRTSLGIWLCTRWGITGADGLPNPEDPIFRGLWLSSARSVRTNVRRPDNAPILDPRPSIQFDLTRPLEPQLAAAKRYLRNQQTYFEGRGVVDKRARARAQSGDIYRRYLQALDAHSANVSVSKIGEKLFPGDANPYPSRPRDQKVRKMIQTANTLRDGGYRDLPTLAAKNKTPR